MMSVGISNSLTCTLLPTKEGENEENGRRRRRREESIGEMALFGWHDGTMGFANRGR
jgi:hypothetical protein